MKIQYQLWLILSLLIIAFSFAVYMVVSNGYEQRLQTGYEQISIAHGSAILDVVADMYPVSPKRSSSYLRNYSDQLYSRFILLDENKKVFADSFEDLVTGSTLNLAIFSQNDDYASDFLYTDAFGYVQYTLLPFESAGTTGYLLMIQEARQLYSEINSFRYWMIRALAISLIIFFLLSYIVTTWLTKPIRQIIISLKKITPRKRTFSLPYRRRDEIYELIDAIQSMVGELNLYDERKRRFLSTSSHELKTPLATMQLILENMPYVRESEEKYQEFVQDLAFQIQKMKQMVEQLLQITRILDKPLHKEMVSQEEIRDHLLQSFQYLAENKQIPLEFDFKEAVFCVDRDLFFRALDNLVSNAIRYSPVKNPVKITIRNKGTQNIIIVCDQGIGISPEDLPHIFEPFYRANDATAYNQEGSGLGLTIVKHIVESHKGSITMESNPAQGTCVILTFPHSV